MWWIAYTYFERFGVRIVFNVIKHWSKNISFILVFFLLLWLHLIVDSFSCKLRKKKKNSEKRNIDIVIETYWKWCNDRNPFCCRYKQKSRWTELFSMHENDFNHVRFFQFKKKFIYTCILLNENLIKKPESSEKYQFQFLFTGNGTLVS